MIGLHLPGTLRLCFGPALRLLLAGLALDFGLTRPRVAEVQALCARRAAASEQLSQLAARDWAAGRIHVRLGGERSADSLTASGNDLEELARKIDAAGLRRLEIVARETTREGNLLVARYSVRVAGDFRQNLEFVRLLETDARLTLLDSFRIEPVAGSYGLDAAYDLRLIDPIPAGGAAS
jgi:hypothetical protein